MQNVNSPHIVCELLSLSRQFNRPNLMMNHPVMVKNHENEKPILRYFAEWPKSNDDDNSIYTWGAGCTSYSSGGFKIGWKIWKDWKKS